MGRYTIRRILLIFPTLLVATLLLAMMVRLLPGDVIDLMVSGARGNRAKSEDAKDILRAKLGLDEPFYVQYISWIVGWPRTEGKVFKSSDGGTTWRKLGAETVEPIGHIQFLSPTLGWALGAGTIFSTEDGGTLWSRQHNSKDLNLNAIFVLDEQTGWAVGEEGTILHTSIGGVRQSTGPNKTISSWLPQDSGIISGLTDVNFVDLDNGWAVGENGVILHTTDGGGNWGTQNSNIEADLNALTFVDANNGWAVGEAGSILRTTDAGLTWSSVDSGITEPLHDIAFANNLHIWAVGGKGTVLYSSDAGLSWEVKSDLAIDQNLSVVTFGNELQGMIGGDGGTLLSTSDGGDTWAALNIVYVERIENTPTEIGPITKPIKDVSLIVSDTGSVRAWVPTLETNWKWGAIGGNLGNRFTLGGRAVTEEIKRSLPPSLELMTFTIIFALIIAIPVGINSALRQDTLGDYLGRSVAIGGLAIPTFYLGTLVIVIPSVLFGWSPQLIYVPFSEDPKTNLSFFLLPTLVGGLPAMAEVMRMTRNMMLEVLRQDYIRTAWAKGLRERAVVVKHALKNAMIPVVTLIGFMIPFQLGQLLVVERIFNIPGMGTLLFSGIDKRDYPLLLGTALFMGIIVVVGNLVVDLTYSWLDPRIRYK